MSIKTPKMPAFLCATALFITGCAQHTLSASGRPADSRSPASTVETMERLAQAIAKEEAELKIEQDKVVALKAMLAQAEFKSNMWQMTGVAGGFTASGGFIVGSVAAANAAMLPGRGFSTPTKVAIAAGGVALASGLVAIVGANYKMELTAVEMKKLQASLDVLGPSLTARLEVINKLKARLGPEYKDLTVSIEPHDVKPLLVPVQP